VHRPFRKVVFVLRFIFYNSMELRQDKQIDVEGREEIPSPHPRDAITGWRWALTLIGLFMGGFLYGELFKLPK
jgi:hypothetical protein